MFTAVMMILAILQLVHSIDLTMKTWMILIMIYTGLVEVYTWYKN